MNVLLSLFLLKNVVSGNFSSKSIRGKVAKVENLYCPTINDYIPPETSNCWNWSERNVNHQYGCDFPSCERAVCACDPYCCEVSWDIQCAGGVNNNFNDDNRTHTESCSAYVLCCKNDKILQKMNVKAPSCKTEKWSPPKDSSCWDWNGIKDERIQKGCDYKKCEEAVCACDDTCCDRGFDLFCRGMKVNTSQHLDNPLVPGCSASILCCENENEESFVSDETTRDISCEEFPKDAPECEEAEVEPSKFRHLNPHEIDPFSVSRIAFSSCVQPDNEDHHFSHFFWKHIRYEFKPDLFIWLGDNAYSDGEDMNKKRNRYNEVRNDQYYQKYGPVAYPRIPTTGIWDDHDYGNNNQGGEYVCKEGSQREFCIHFSIPKTDPRHPDYIGKKCKRRGVYSSLLHPPPLFYDVNTTTGVHVINLDTRINRSHVRGTCQDNVTNIDILSKEQWAWLYQELFEKKSEIKIISSSINVLTPTNFKIDLKHYCAYDGGEKEEGEEEKQDSSFLKAIQKLDEGEHTEGGRDKEYDLWSDVPVARAKLLRWAQKSINLNMTKKVIFLSGGLHFGDLYAKRMNSNSEWGNEQVLYEVVASGVGRERNRHFPTAHRVRLRSCDNEGDGYFYNECKFPFYYKNKTFYDCTNIDSVYNMSWCYFEQQKDKEDDSEWGYCLQESNEIVPKVNQTVTKVTCGDTYHQTCGMRYVYGGVDIDWKLKTIQLKLFTPMEDVKDGLASSISLSF